MQHEAADNEQEAIQICLRIELNHFPTNEVRGFILIQYNLALLEFLPPLAFSCYFGPII